MPRVSETYTGSFLTASELTPMGQRRTAVVHAAVREEVGQERKPHIVLDLVSPRGQAWPKRVVLNKGNALQMAAAFGDDSDHWPGRQITIWAENVMFQGRLMPGIKVLPAGNGGAVAPSPQMPPPDPQSPTAAAAVPADAPGKGYAGPGSDLDDEIPF